GPPQIAPATIADKTQLLQWTPLPSQPDFGAAFDANHIINPKRVKQLRQINISKPAIGGEDQSPPPADLPESLNQPFDDGHLIAPHAPLEDGRRVGPPVNGDGACARDQ